MAFDLDGTLRLGGKPLLDFLSFSVLSTQPEPLFVHLAQEYRLAQTAARALALYDVFCAVNALFRLRCAEVLEPFDLRLARSVAPIRAQVELAARPPAAPLEGEDPAPRAVVDLPSPYLFEYLVSHLREVAGGALHRIAQTYDPTRSPRENLPGGQMTAGQRFFVDKVWQPRVRPLLVQAGFWRVLTVG